MDKVRYMISDAANLVHVEAHVLRYWEEELDLAIPRNEMGHRYYTRENIQEFQKIKDLKEKGYQLKAIRMILHNGEAGVETMQNPSSEFAVGRSAQPGSEGQASVHKSDAHSRERMSAGRQEGSGMTPVSVRKDNGAVPAAVRKDCDTVPAALREGYGASSAEERMAQFRELMSDIVGHAIALNNEELSQVIGKEVGEHVLKEMNYLAREQDEAQEERFRKLDAAIRGNLRRKKSLFARDKAAKAEKPKKADKSEKKSNPVVSPS